MIPGPGFYRKKTCLKMKNPLLLFVLLGVVSLVSVGCEKEDDEFLKPLPALPDPEDVGSAVKDPYFREYCYRMFDEDKDGKISLDEAFSVVKIDLSRAEERARIESLDGIGYFVNLESLRCMNCRELTAAELRYNRKITALDAGAFVKCVSLSRIALPERVMTIGPSAFYGCTALSDMLVPNGIMEIGDHAFRDCSALKRIVLPNCVRRIGNYAFKNCFSAEEIILRDNVEEIGTEAFRDCSALKRMLIPDRVATIGYMAFMNCSALERIVVPDGVRTIGSSVFYGCLSLTDVVISNHVTRIPFGTFFCCTSLERIVVPERVTEVEEYAFYGCSGLKEVVLPESCVSIPVESAFAECSRALCVVCKAVRPPAVRGVSSDDSFQTLYVPAGSIEEYRSSDWNRIFREIKPIE